LYRAVKQRQPRLGDFWSDFAHGEEPFRPQLHEPMLWCGISTTDDFETARKRAIELVQGRYIAVLTIPDDADVRVLQTSSSRDPRHHSVMGTPATLHSLVTRIIQIA
jgi:hypothetical protein